MFCANCGSDNPDESVYCGRCGSSLISNSGTATDLTPSPITENEPAATSTPEDIPPVKENPLEQNASNASKDEADMPTMRFSSPMEEKPSSSTSVPEGVENEPTMRFPTPEEDPFSGTEPPIEEAPTMRVAPSPEPPPITPGASEFFHFDNSEPQDRTETAFQGSANDSTQNLFSENATGAPQDAGAPFQPGVPSGEGRYQPMAPGYYDQQASGAYPPINPAYPGQLQASGAYPPVGTGQLSQPGWPGYAITQPPQKPREPSKLINPLPLWLFIGSIIIVALMLGLLTFFTGSDWASGAQTAGIIALIIGILILIAFGARSALGLLAPTNTHRRDQIISALLLALLLFIIAFAGLGQQSSFHSLQGRSLEGQQNWQSAINEYKASGQNESTLADIARTYNEWGEQLSSQQQYDPALGKFTTVITNYSQVTDQLTRAQKDSVSLYQTWANLAVQQHNYTSAVQRYNTLLGLPYCFSSCQTTTRASDATAYYNLAEQQLTSQKYTEAVTDFQQLLSNFGNSPEAQRIHPDYAKALWGVAQQQLNTTCSSALSTYQQLATTFSDTNEGQEAAKALKAPVHVKGHFTGTVPPSGTMPTVFLNKSSVITSSTSANDVETVLTNSPSTNISSDGTFAFTSIAPGQYQLIWGTLNNSDGFIRLRFDVNPTTIGQLCEYNFGDLASQIPVS